MFAGHFALAAATRTTDRTAPLWALMLATQLLDVFFVILFLAGKVEYADEVHAGYGGLFIHADYTHSLVGALTIAAVGGGLAAWRWGRRGGLLFGGLVFSHWILDLLVHRADLPILPGNPGGLPTFGFGLWRIGWLSAVVEGALIVAGTVAYYRSVRRRGGARRRALVAAASMAGLLALALASDLLALE
ncbi:metal-dependent hydrolase [Longispora urticae]